MQFAITGFLIGIMVTGLTPWRLKDWQWWALVLAANGLIVWIV